MYKGESLTPDERRAIRKRKIFYNPSFTRFNMSKKLVSDRKRDVEKLDGPSLRLRSIVRDKKLDVLQKCLFC